MKVEKEEIELARLKIKGKYTKIKAEFEARVDAVDYLSGKLEFVEKKKISKKSWSDHGNEVVWEVGQEGKMRMSHKDAPLHPLRAPMTTHLCTFLESGATFSESHHY